MSSADNNRRTNFMRTIRTKIYKFAELSEDAKKKSVKNFLNSNEYSFAWEKTKENAEQIGLIIKYLDDRHGNAGEFSESAISTGNQIIENHGASCDTYKTTKQFLSDYDSLVEKYSDGINKNKVTEGNEYEFDNEADELESEFMQSLLFDYKSIYEQELDYEYSDEYATEMIEANEYEFTKDGKIFN